MLQENIDYTVDYTNGSVKVINPAIIQFGCPVNIRYEKMPVMERQQQGFMGCDWTMSPKVRATQSLAFGGTIERLNERPYFTKTNYGEDPIRNTMYGVDVNFRSQWPGLTDSLINCPGLLPRK